ncbi:MAG: thioredoxin domain-containing protein [Kordia sp.]|nr:MAG: thioredoxin domain-containing protein [Kordia sp.]
MRYLTTPFLFILLFSCKGQNSDSKKTTHQFTNELSKETSPYLLQHAHNPVNWKPWNSNTLLEAKTSNKLIIISIGYSACHWCHVMEEESFEDTAVAKVMNDNFISIKVDREERPDVDQVYMSAVQLLTGRGGWPLNVIALPDGRPIWGGTYFRKNQWIDALTQLQKQFETDPEKLNTYADNLEKGIITSELIAVNHDKTEFKTEYVSTVVNHWKKSFDHKYGATKRAPKFMLPSNYSFLLKYAHLQNDSELLKYVNLTLTKMAFGGVFDHVDGGFSRYSTDIRWHIPHFEKMLYDNGQLVSLYADAYKLTKNELYKTTIEKTLQFVEQELYNDKGYFYSSLDADSYNSIGEKEEGAYYVWTKDELKEILKNDYKIFADFYNVNEYGYWENGHYVLTRKDSYKKIATKFKTSTEALKKTLNDCVSKLQNTRTKKTKPALDDKTLTSWNALMATGYLVAYEALGERKHLNTAIKNANFITNNLFKKDGGLYHNFKNGKSTINGYLEDYATTIQLFIKLHENTLDPSWLYSAKKLSDYCFTHFYNQENNLFYFTSDQDPKLVVRNIEYQDNVIPASNSIMAKNLFLLGIHFNNKLYSETSKKMLHNITPQINNYGAGFSNWLDLYLMNTERFQEIVITGDTAMSKTKTLKKHYLPNMLFTGSDSSVKNSDSSSNLPLLQNRTVPKKTYIYICENSACLLPLENIDQALTLIKK